MPFHRAVRNFKVLLSGDDNWKDHFDKNSVLEYIKSTAHATPDGEIEVNMAAAYLTGIWDRALKRALRDHPNAKDNVMAVVTYHGCFDHDDKARNDFGRAFQKDVFAGAAWKERMTEHRAALNAIKSHPAASLWANSMVRTLFLSLLIIMSAFNKYFPRRMSSLSSLTVAG